MIIENGCHVIGTKVLLSYSQVYEEREHVYGVGNFCARQHPNLVSQIGCRRINPLGSGCFTAEISSLISMSVLRSPRPVCFCPLGYKIQQAKEGKTNLLEPKYQSISKERNKEKQTK